MLLETNCDRCRFLVRAWPTPGAEGNPSPRVGRRITSGFPTGWLGQSEAAPQWRAALGLRFAQPPATPKSESYSPGDPNPEEPTLHAPR